MIKSNIVTEFKKDSLLTVIDFLTRYFGGKKQFLPESNELENKEVIELSKRLRRGSEKETLSNLLEFEWQNRNISYWVERGYLDGFLVRVLIGVGLIPILIFISVPIAVSFYLIFTRIFSIPSDLSSAISIVIIIGLILWILLKANTLLKIAYIILWSYPLYEVVKITLLKSPAPQNISSLLNFTVFNWIIFGFSLFLLIYLFLVYESIARQTHPLKYKIKEILSLINSTFEVSIPCSTILRYKMAICNDYAKLTAVLLYNLFPGNSIYFISIPRHVAAGVEVNGRMYILDQKLPVMTLDGWLRIWNRKTATVYGLKILDTDGKRKLKLEKREMAELENPAPNVNIEKLTDEVVKLLGINRSTQKENSVVEIPPFSRLAKCYEGDEIVIYSMARAIKLKLEAELCSNIENIEKIEIKQNDNDLIVLVYLRQV